ncbi:MAG: Spy/CpxP family protein refolding chaperone [Pseudolabrys sp.]
MRPRWFARPAPAARPAQRPAIRSAAPALRQNPAAQPNTARQQRRLIQQQNRAEQRLQRQENRSLRALPPAQRAQRLQDIRQQRALRTQQRQNALGTTNGNALQPNARGNNAARISNPAIRQGLASGRFAQGRFAQGRFAQGRQNLLAQNGNGARLARANAQAQALNRFAVPRQSWHRGRRAAFVAWIGATYWPYAYSDLFDYTFFPYAYEDDYWGAAYDDMFDGVFWADGGPYAGAYDGAYDGTYTYAAAPSGSGKPPARIRSAIQSANQACRTPGQGITAWPFAQIRRAVKLTDNQQDLLRDLETAAKNAADTFKAACPTDAPLTPPGRLDAVIARLQATLNAVEIVRPPLDAFYTSLSDEQKARFNLIGPTIGQSADDKTARQETLQASGKICKESKPGLVDLPVDSIEATVKPTDAQRPALEKLQQATRDAVDKLSAACPDDISQTPTGRLEQASMRLKAMIDAANTVKPALDDFFAGLSDEQKSRFNTMQGAALAGNDTDNN